ncbi:MAG: hypothetical protein LJE70_16540 [Chromatiaceae bacterium]|nr:hypothetical protein [Chromatiaceae bacterium]
MGQVRRWLEKRDEAKEQEAEQRLEFGRIEQAYRDFWNQALRRGYRPDEIASARNGCFGIGDLKRLAKRWRILLDI